MIKHVILVGNGGCYAEGVSGHDISDFYEDPGTALLVSDHESNDGIFIGKDITFKHKDMVTVFPLPAKRSDFLSVTCYPLSEMFGNNTPRTKVVFSANDSFNLPNSVFKDVISTSTTIDTEGKIIPGIYGFMLVKKNVSFNKRNRWYIEVIVKEDTTYSDFKDILDAKFKEIDPNLSLTVASSTFTLSTSNGIDKAYDLMFDDLAKFAFTKVSSNGRNNRGKHFLRKICREADANYGFNYTTVEGTELYKNRTDEMYNELFTLSQSPACSLFVLNIKFNEPSYYRTVDEKINKVITIIADWTTIDVLMKALQLTYDNVVTLYDDYDINDSGAVDIDDMNIIINILLRRENYNLTNYPKADLNGDGVVDIDDSNSMINKLLRKTDPASTPMKVSALAAGNYLDTPISNAISFLANKYQYNASNVTYNGVGDAIEELMSAQNS